MTSWSQRIQKPRKGPSTTVEGQVDSYSSNKHLQSLRYEMKKKRGVGLYASLVYILPEAWNRAKVLLSGSWRTANHPMFGISSFPLTTFAPRFVALARDWSMFTTLKWLRNPVSPMVFLYIPPMVSFSPASL